MPLDNVKIIELNIDVNHFSDDPDRRLDVVVGDRHFSSYADALQALKCILADIDAEYGLKKRDGETD